MVTETKLCNFLSWYTAKARQRQRLVFQSCRSNACKLQESILDFRLEGKTCLTPTMEDGILDNLAEK